MYLNFIFILLSSPLTTAQTFCDPTEPYPFENCSSLVELNQMESGTQKNYIYADPKNKGGSSRDLIQYKKVDFFIDLNQIDPSQPMSQDFILKDFLRSENGRYGMFQTHALEHVQKIRSDLNRALIINSGFRSPGHNKKISGASDWSRHMYGDAVDISARTSKEIKELQKQCEATLAWVFLYSDHVHCDWRDEPLDSNFYNNLPFNKFQVFSRIKHLEKLKLKHENLIQAQLLFNENSNTTVFSEGKKEVQLKLESHLGGTEDHEGELFVEWRLFDSENNLLQEFTGAQNTLTLEKGNYLLKATVGGYKTIQRSIVID